MSLNSQKTGPAQSDDSIVIHGAREHNLKNITVTIPRGRFVVITGVSGSGKSTLAFDLLFAEGQRRFLDSMNAYARQFVEQLSRPDVDLITGIPPTVSIEQRSTRGGGKSTVATVTEIYHFLRLLYARLGILYCPDCQTPVEPQTRDQVGLRLKLEVKQRGDLMLLAPVIKGRKGFHTDVAEWAAKQGYAKIRADGKIVATKDRLRLDRFKEHNVEIVAGSLLKPWSVAPSESSLQAVRVPSSKSSRQAARASSSEFSLQAVRASLSPQQLIDKTLALGQGTLLALDGRGKVTVHSTERTCVTCGRSFELLDPKMFSYNSSSGWCPKCRGFGELFYLPEADRGARADDIEESWFDWMEGKRELCPECHGTRINAIARAVRLPVSKAGQKALEHLRVTYGATHTPGDGITIEEFGEASVHEAFTFFGTLGFEGASGQVARDILPEIGERLRFLREVGLGYLQLGRSVTTLSGGESQRIRLAAQLGSNLSGVLYVLDEPTIGLHARDNEQLLHTLARLQARGNSLVVVEHDEATMRHADYIIDLGPGAGVRGGELVAAGTLKELLKHKDSITGQCLRQKRTFPTRGNRRPVDTKPASARKTKALSRVGDDIRSLAISPDKVRDSSRRLLPSEGMAAPTEWLTLQHAKTHNLKDIKVRFPLHRLVVITGVSGSGKSTLIRECLLPAVKAHLPGGKGASDCELSSFESIHAVYEVDQSPIGRTPRSIPATYVGFFDEIRHIFSQVPESRLRGYSPSRFSFNSAQGRCPECEGAGMVKLEMNFLPPAYVRCETCGGLRFNPETLDVVLNGKNIAQVLALSVAEALDYFSAFPRLKRPLQALVDTGLDYLHLGQTSPTLSGGEAQRVKLVTHLLTGLQSPDMKRLRAGPKKSSLFILEEPTIGLHIADVQRLVDVLQRLVDAGHTVIVIEHNLDLIAEADWVIDLGPEGGEAGGRIVVEGTPEDIVKNKASHTGRFLSEVLSQAQK